LNLVGNSIKSVTNCTGFEHNPDSYRDASLKLRYPLTANLQTWTIKGFLIMENLKKAYYLFFYKLYLVFNYLSEDSWGYWKAGLVIQTLQYFILFVIIMQIEIISKNYVIPDFDPKLWEIPLAIILAVFNYYVFLYKKDWKQYIDEFSRYSKKKI
jgi:hypothetical protein